MEELYAFLKSTHLNKVVIDIHNGHLEVNIP